MREFETVLIKNSISESSLPKKRNRKSKMNIDDLFKINNTLYYKYLTHFYEYPYNNKLN